MKRWTRERLLKQGVPLALIPGILAAIAMGWKTGQLSGKFSELEVIFSKTAVEEAVTDGDSFFLPNGFGVWLMGIDAPERGEEGFDEAKNKLERMIKNKKIYLEYDRDLVEHFGRLLAWVWVGCEAEPKFLPADYMYKNKSASKPGLTENPPGCKEGKLVNEVMLDSGLAEIDFNPKRGEMKYKGRLRE